MIHTANHNDIDIQIYMISQRLQDRMVKDWLIINRQIRRIHMEKQIMVDEPTVSHYKTEFTIDKNLYEQWMCGEYTKCVLGAKNKNQLLKAKTMAEDLGMVENKDFWLIYDNCHTELKPEENGRTLTVIGFKPMDSGVIDQIGRKYQLYI